MQKDKTLPEIQLFTKNFITFNITSSKHTAMDFIDRMSNGWKISMNSFKVLGANKKLIIFPVLSGISFFFYGHMGRLGLGF
jgi:hypothetical protein